MDWFDDYLKRKMTTAETTGAVFSWWERILIWVLSSYLLFRIDGQIGAMDFLYSVPIVLISLNAFVMIFAFVFWLMFWASNDPLKNEIPIVSLALALVASALVYFSLIPRETLFFSGGVILSFISETYVKIHLMRETADVNLPTYRVGHQVSRLSFLDFGCIDTEEKAKIAIREFLLKKFRPKSLMVELKRTGNYWLVDALLDGKPKRFKIDQGGKITEE